MPIDKLTGKARTDIAKVSSVTASWISYVDWIEAPSWASNWLLNWLLLHHPFNSDWTDQHASNDLSATNMAFSWWVATFDGSTSDLYIASWSDFERSAWDFTIAFKFSTTKSDNMFIKTSERWGTWANDYWYDIFTAGWNSIFVRTCNWWDGASAITSNSFSDSSRNDWNDHTLMVTFWYNGSDANDVEVFLDNVSIWTASNAKDIAYNTRGTYIGTYYWTWIWSHPFSNDFDWDMSKLSMRNRILTSDERSDWYDGWSVLDYSLFTS